MRYTLLLLLTLVSVALWAQIVPGVYLAKENLDQGTRNFLLLVSDTYMVHTVYESDPDNFVLAKGGFYQIEGDSLKVDLEFNSRYESDGEQVHRAQMAHHEQGIIFNGNDQRHYKRQPTWSQDLDGQWLFATRGPDTGQERRGDHVARKTQKFLQDGYFLWIAYHTETMKFSGTGGGRYTADNGTYTERIQFFSRDSSRVGAELQFQYEVEGNDWHHQGKNSRGEPMYEIWGKR